LTYWGEQNSHFDQRKYFNIRREDVFIVQAEDTSSNAGTVFQYDGVRRTCCL